jgi:hypothetical protein
VALNEIQYNRNNDKSGGISKKTAVAYCNILRGYFLRGNNVKVKKVKLSPCLTN